MSISGISSNLNQNQSSAASTTIQQEFQQLAADLESGNLSLAQSEFATLQAAFSQSTTSSSSSTSSSASATSDSITQAFNQLASDLKSGNLSAAQKDFSTVQQDLQSQGGPSTGHHHHHHISTGSGDSSTQNPLLQDLNQVGQSLTSSNLSGAQAAYATLQQELQQFALGGGSLSSSQTSALLAQPPVSLDA